MTRKACHCLLMALLLFTAFLLAPAAAHGCPDPDFPGYRRETLASRRDELRQHVTLVSAIVLGALLLAGAGKLLYDMKKQPTQTPQPQKPWERLP